MNEGLGELRVSQTLFYAAVSRVYRDAWTTRRLAADTASGRRNWTWQFPAVCNDQF